MKIISKTKAIIRQGWLPISIIIISIKESLNFISSAICITDKKSSEDKIHIKLLLIAHSLEKGLSFRVIRAGFGVEKAIGLINTLEQYISFGYSINHYAALESIAILERYIFYKKSINEDISDIIIRYKNLISKTNIQNNYCEAGVETILNSELSVINKSQVQELFNKTRSIRNYDLSKSVTEEDILSSIDMARMAPSACNRQPIKIYYTMDPSKNTEVSKLVPGNKGFESSIPNFLIITVSKTYFGSSEYNQWFVNGGIFIGYLRLALQANGLGHCIFQWSKLANEKQMRQLCSIPKNECIVSIIGCGYYAGTSYCIKAQRKSTEEYISKF